MWWRWKEEVGLKVLRTQPGAACSVGVGASHVSG